MSNECAFCLLCPILNFCWRVGNQKRVMWALCNELYLFIICLVQKLIKRFTSSNPGRSSGRIFFSGVNFVCWLLFSVRSTPVLPQWHVKDPSHSAKSAGGRLHLNIIHPWLIKVGVGWLCRCPVIVWEPIRKRAHTQLIREHSHSVTVILACWATVDWSWPEEWNYLRELIFI